ncbi:flippase [Microcoleus sp. FACHB-831]|uniref:flippase n=1 Tax=Microcoleus sp. FACHB-831 TaxID=2692827 RepID=UPI001687D0D6|nr:flippase [Microcoleus sp. FACHB-831]MBD1922874.1 flippase [Microcoleus sp. FACHB-831]
MLDKLAAVSQKITPGLRKVIGNTIWLSGDQILRLFIGLLVGRLVADYLAPYQFGLYNVSLAWAGLFGPIAKLGLDNIVVRDLTRSPSVKNEILGTAFVLKVIGAVLTLVLSIVAITLIKSPDSDITRWLVAIVAAATIFQSFETVDFWFQSQVQAKYTVWARTAAVLVISIVRIAFIQMRFPLVAFAWAMFAENVLIAIGLVLVYQKNGNSIKLWTGSVERGKALVKESWPLILSGMVIMIYMRIDQIMLQQMKNAEAVGLYAAAVKPSEMWYFVPTAIVNSVTPSIVKAKAAGEKIYYERIQTLFNLVVLLSYAVAIPITIFSSQIIMIVAGKKYIEAAPVLEVLVWAGLFVSLGLARVPWLITEGFMKFSAVTTAIGALINVVLNLLLIPSYGGLGAGIATVIAQFFAAYGAGAFYPKTRKIFIQQTKALFMIDVFKILIKKLKGL